MRKFFACIVAAALASCLIADPCMSISLPGPHPPDPTFALNAFFQEEALQAALIESQYAGAQGNLGPEARVAAVMENERPDSAPMPVDVSSLVAYHQNNKAMVESAIAALYQVSPQRGGDLIKEWIYFCDYAVLKSPIPETKIELTRELRRLVRFLAQLLGNSTFRVTAILLNTLSECMVQTGSAFDIHSYKLECHENRTFKILSSQLLRLTNLHHELQESAA